MKVFNIFRAMFLMVAVFGIHTASAQVTIAGSAGNADGTYPTLKLAFDALNEVSSTQTGKTIVVTLTASTTEVSAAVLKQPQIGAWTSLKIYPTTTGLSIGGDLATPLIDLDGADNVAIDGRVNQTGAKDLVISNTSISNATGTSSIRLINDASNNAIQYCTIKSSSRALYGGAIYIATTTGTSGNNNNTIDNNDITSCSVANRPFNAILSSGTNDKANSGNTFSNNNIFDFVSPVTNSYGIYFFSSTTDCVITGNSFYETTSFVSSGTYDYRPIHIPFNVPGKNFTITNNYIGGSAPLCGGTNAWRNVNGGNNSFVGISISTSAVDASNVQGNTIANFEHSNTGANSWIGINAAGNVNIGNTAGNVIGAATGTGSIKYNAGASNGSFYGLNLNGITGTVRNNTIASIQTSATNAAHAVQFYGIYITGVSPCTITNNTIGSVATPNSINATSGATSNAQYVYGIYSEASSSITISGNTIANLTNGTTNSTTGPTGSINGICITAGSNNISSNIIRDLSIANANNSATTQSVCGIFLNYTTAGKVQSITDNTIFNLKNTFATFAGNVSGLYFNGSPTQAVISGNFIHSLSVTGASSTAATLYGISMNTSSAATYANNIINLAGNTRTTIYGIYETGSTGNKNNLYFNTINISGTPTTGTNQSYCLYSAATTNIRDFRNNIFNNTRSNAGATGKHFAVYLAYNTNTGLTINNNDYFASGTGGMLGYNAAGTYNAANDKTTLTAWKTATGQDANSLAINPSFASAGGTAALNYYPSAVLAAATGTPIIADYSNYARNVTPKMGAVEFASAPAPGSNTVSVYQGATLLASYLNIRDAFARINDGTHTGSITVKITGSQTLPATALLNASGTGATNYTDVTMYPTTTGLTISGNGNFAEPLIDLNGADNVVIDGRVNGTGSTKSLVITNPGIVSSTIRFINDATGNTVKYCTLKGSTTVDIDGIISFGTTNGTTGNDGNTISNNDITNAADANRPVNAIFSMGTTKGMENSDNTISNNNIYDFLNRGIASFGINLSSYTADWTITGNSFYETASFVPTASVEYRVINIFPAGNGWTFTINNNFIGGSAQLCGGTAWTKTNAFDNTFIGIYVNAGVVTSNANNIQGNTITNINYSNSAGAYWYGMQYVGSGFTNVGTTTGNTIGAATGNGAIVFTSGATSIFYGINTTAQSIIQNNSIGAITVANSNAASSSSFYGISGSASLQYIKNNVIGSTHAGTTNSINVTAASTATNQLVYGIYASSFSTTVIAENTIAKMTNGTTNSTVAMAGLINGITAANGSNTITNNIVRDLTIANANTSFTNTSSISGIVLNTTASATQTISGNTIYNLSNTNASFAGSVIGIYYNGSTTAGKVSGNFIHGLSVTGASSTAASLYGIKINAGITTYSNNIINIGGNSKTNLYGIYETGAPTNNNNLYFNTVFIGGTPASGTTNKSYALYSAVTTNKRDFRNNIFSNVRSTSGGTGLHYAAWFNYAVSTNLTLDNNNYYAPGTGGVLGYFNSVNAPTVPLITGMDANSLAINPAFASAGGTAVLNYYPSASLPAVAGTGTLTDLTENTRNTTTPKMGAIEAASSSNAVDLYVGAVLQTSLKNIAAAFDRINDGIYTGAITLKITASQELNTTATLNASGIGSANYTSVAIYPTISGLSISGDLASPLINLNGANNVTIDGRVNASGAAKDLVITNRSASTLSETSTIQFTNDASNNTVKYCTVKGSSMSSLTAVIYFAATSGTTGNDNNLIDNNDITCAADANRPTSGVRSNGKPGTENNNNTISNNNIFNFQNRSLTSYGINLLNGSDKWTVTGNSFYETAPLVPTANVACYPIYIAASNYVDFNVSNNYIGGSAPECGGAAWTKTNTNNNEFNAINVLVGSTTASSIQGNTIKNFDYSNSLNASWFGINARGGNVNIGTTAGNVIGGATGNSSIKVTNGTSLGAVMGINIGNNATGIADVRNNTIGSITAENTLGTAATSIFGISKTAMYPATIINNTIGSTDAGTSNSLNATSTATGNVQAVYGIYNSGATLVTISGNTISKLTNGTIKPDGFVTGIYNLSSIGGDVSGNLITDLLISGTSLAKVYGVSINNGVSTYSNNIISLGGNTETDVYGIYETGIAGSDNSLYFNTIYLGGSLGTGVTNKSYALYSNASTNTRNIRNNIFSNQRTTSDGVSLHYAAWFNYATSAKLTLGNNDYYAPGTGGVLGYYNSVDVTTLPLIASIDANSLAINPLFNNAGGKLATDYFTGASLAGIAGTGITTDYLSTIRAATPRMGALELSGPLPVTFTSIKATQQNSPIVRQLPDIAVEWKVENQIDIRAYDVEKSLDGFTFNKVVTLQAFGINGTNITYNWLDMNGVSGDNFYRVRSIGKNGQIKYSTIVKVNIASGNSLVTVYPNPVINRLMNVQFAGMDKGVYHLRLINAKGQPVFVSTLSHVGGTIIHAVKLGYCTPGNYQLEIVNPDNTRSVKSVVVLN